MFLMNSPVKKMSEFVGGGYNEFWKFKGRYRVCKGSRASKKSKTTALWFASWLNKKGYEKANLIVFRKTYRTIKDSCFTDLKWALDRLGLIDEWNITLSPLEMTRKKTGQKILFRGGALLSVHSLRVLALIPWLKHEQPQNHGNCKQTCHYFPYHTTAHIFSYIWCLTT